MKKRFFIGIILVFTIGKAQENNVLQQRDSLKPVLTQAEIELLDTIKIYPKLVLKTPEDQKLYNDLRRRVYRVWPYVIKIKNIYLQNLIETQNFQKRSEIRRYNRAKEDELIKEFKPVADSLSHKSGLIMIKLIKRQTGVSVFNIVKQSKSGWSAFWWNRLASLNSMNLKARLDIVANKEDYLIEYIVNEGIMNGTLRTY